MLTFSHKPCTARNNTMTHNTTRRKHSAEAKSWVFIYDRTLTAVVMSSSEYQSPTHTEAANLVRLGHMITHTSHGFVNVNTEMCLDSLRPHNLTDDRHKKYASNVHELQKSKFSTKVTDVSWNSQNHFLPSHFAVGEDRGWADSGADETSVE